ncbi:MAG: NYN domain-containing protein [Planctomycetaceae bacterium]|nr:NYN domain-containing protein [Planctomycetaceae bacterium]
MAKRYLIIDGYNFLHAAGMFPRRVDGITLENARKRLARFLEARLSPGERDRTTIVFDVRRNRSEVPPREFVSRMTILNAVEHADADSLIEQLIQEHAVPKQVLVVSSDHRLHRAARSRQARAIDSEQFHEQMQQRLPRHRPQQHTRSRYTPLDQPTLPESTTTSSEEVAHWERRIRELFEEE